MIALSPRMLLHHLCTWSFFSESYGVDVAQAINPWNRWLNDVLQRISRPPLPSQEIMRSLQQQCLTQSALVDRRYQQSFHYSRSSVQDKSVVGEGTRPNVVSRNVTSQRDSRKGNVCKKNSRQSQGAHLLFRLSCRFSVTFLKALSLCLRRQVNWGYFWTGQSPWSRSSSWQNFRFFCSATGNSELRKSNKEHLINSFISLIL